MIESLGSTPMWCRVRRTSESTITSKAAGTYKKIRDQYCGLGRGFMKMDGRD